jgi:hypothetical protein
VTRKFYRPWRIFRRLVRHIRRPNGIKTVLYHAAINVAYYGRVVRWKIKGYDPALKHEGAPEKAPDYASADAVGDGMPCPTDKKCRISRPQSIPEK